MGVGEERLARRADPSADIWLEASDVRWFTQAEMEPWAYRPRGPAPRPRRRSGGQLVEDGVAGLSRAAAAVFPGEAALATAGAVPASLPTRAGDKAFRQGRRRWSARRKRRFAGRFVPAVTLALSTAVAAPLVVRPAGTTVSAPATPAATPVTAPPAPTIDPPAPASQPSTAAAPALIQSLPQPAADPTASVLVQTPVPVESAPAVDEAVQAPARRYPRIIWAESESHGVPHSGHLHAGVRLPIEGEEWATWDPVNNRVPNRTARLYGHDELIRTILKVVRGYSRDHPAAAGVLIGDLSRRTGGPLDAHVSHQNGLDVDVYYPRKDGKVREPTSVNQIDLALAQDLVDRFVAAGAQLVLVGPNTPLSGPRGVVQKYQNHDNHMHVRIRPQG